MAYRIFSIAIPSDGGEEELNRFLASHRVASVRTQWVTRTDGGESVPYQVFTVEWVAGKAAQEGLATPGQGEATARVDYRERLSPEDFAVYNKLREVRKRLAEGEGVKPFVVFTNAQLAAIAQTRPGSLAGLREVEGVGEARAGKYGAAVLEALRPAGAGASASDESREASDKWEEGKDADVSRIPPGFAPGEEGEGVV